MSKRPSETTMDSPTKKKIIMTTDQVVFMKREFQKGAARLENNVIYKLDCRTVNEKKQNLVYVRTKEMYDSIEINCSYKFTIERQENKRWYLINYEKLQDCKIAIKENLDTKDFEKETETLVNFFIEGAYDCNNNDSIKIFGYVKIDNEYRQCDLVVKLNGPSCFNFETHESKKNRSDRALTKIYKEMINKWWVFQVMCRKIYNNYSLLILDNTIYEESNVSDIVTQLVQNVSYVSEKRYKMSEIIQVSKCEYVQSANPRIAFSLTTIDNNLLFGSKFNVKEDDAHDLLSDVNSINFEINTGAKFYCIYCFKLDDSKMYNNIVSIVCVDDEEQASSLFSA
nr:late expression factor 3 [Pieris rapae granulovirus]